MVHTSSFLSLHGDKIWILNNKRFEPFRALWIPNTHWIERNTGFFFAGDRLLKDLERRSWCPSTDGFTVSSSGEKMVLEMPQLGPLPSMYLQETIVLPFPTLASQMCLIFFCEMRWNQGKSSAKATIHLPRHQFLPHLLWIWAHSHLLKKGIFLNDAATICWLSFTDSST